MDAAPEEALERISKGEIAEVTWAHRGRTLLSALYQGCFDVKGPELETRREARRKENTYSISFTHLTRENAVDCACASVHLPAARYLKNRQKVKKKSLKGQLLKAS